MRYSGSLSANVRFWSATASRSPRPAPRVAAALAWWRGLKRSLHFYRQITRAAVDLAESSCGGMSVPRMLLRCAASLLSLVHFPSCCIDGLEIDSLVQSRSNRFH